MSESHVYRFLDNAGAERVLRSFQKLATHDIADWVLVGGLAVEIHCLRAGGPPSRRQLNDIDFIAPSFDRLPDTLANDFLFRHAHPQDPPGKMILQMADAETALRIDVFRACGASLARSQAAGFPWGSVRLASEEDVLAHTARLLLELNANVLVAVKHAQDYIRLKKITDLAATGIAWPDHRKPEHPATFEGANFLIEALLKSRGELLSTPEYSKDVHQVCPRCVATRAFPLAGPRRILALLGYC